MGAIIKKNNFFDIYSSYIANFLSQRTRTEYVQDLQDFILFLEDQNIFPQHPGEITEIHIIEYRQYCIQKYAPNTVIRKLSSLASFFSELKEKQIVTHNPVKGVRRPKGVVKKEGLGFSDEEVSLILGAFDETNTIELNQKTLLTFLFFTGCRISETLYVKVKDFQFHGGTWVVHINGKGSKMRTLPIHPKLWMLVESLVKLRQKNVDDYLFTSIKQNSSKPLTRDYVHKLLKLTLLKLGLDSTRSLHSCRRTVISHLLEKGERLEIVQELAGHSLTSTTQKYNVRKESLLNNPLLKMKYKKPPFS